MIVAVVDVALVLDVPVGAGTAGAGDGVSICPANTETASVRLRIVAAHIRKDFTFTGLLVSCKNFARPN